MRKNFINIDTKELFELVRNNEKKIIYIGRATCPGCSEMEPILNSVLEDKKIHAYYYDTSRAREKELEEFYKAREKFNAQYIPLLIRFDSSKEAERIDYYKFVESADNIVDLVERFVEDKIL